MSCCSPLIIPFVNEATKSIPYGTVQQEMYGERPNVQVWYNEAGEYVLSPDFNEIAFTGSAIDLDFGGPNTGIIKVF